MKIAIVGGSAKHWKGDGERKAKIEIKSIFFRYADFVYGNTTFSMGYITGWSFDGVDTWAEELARTLKIKSRIFRPQIFQWNDSSENKLKGFMSRNKEVAESCDILYVIEPKGRTRSGGLWTANYAESIGKQVHRITIE